MFGQISRVTSMLAFGLAGLSDFVMGDQVQDPVRLRLNSDIITTLFHKGDQRILDAFQDIKVSPGEEEGAVFGDLDFSVDTPPGVSRDDYNFDVLIQDEKEPDFLGFRGADLLVSGSGSLADESVFSFTVPIDKVEMELEWVPEDA